MKPLEKLIFEETQGLPSNILDEILIFIQFIKEKKFKHKKKYAYDNLKFELNSLNNNELSHLENEFKDYKELYPREK